MYNIEQINNKVYLLIQERDVDLQVVKDFPVLMSQLAQRYFRDKESSAQQSGEIEAIRQEVNELKTMIRDMTKRY